MKKMVYGVLVAATLAVSSMSTPALADPVDLRIGWAQVPSQITPLVAELAKTHPELFANFNRTYRYDPIRFQGSTPQIQALAADQLDIGAFGPSALALGVTNAHLDLRMIADVMQDGADGYYTTWWAVRKDGPIQKFEDMKGHRAAVNAKGATTDMQLRASLRKHDVGDNDFVEVEADFANMFAMAEADKVDVVPVMPQFSHDFEATDKYRALFTTRQFMGGSDEVGFWVAKADFIAAHRAALVDMLTDHMAAVRWFLDPKNRDAAMTITEAFTKQSPDAVAYVFTKGDIYRSPDLVPNVKAVQQDIDQAAAMSLLPTRIEAAPRYTDLTLVEEAKTRLDKK